MFRHIWLQFWWQWMGIHSPRPLDDGGIAGHLMGRRVGTAAGLGHVGGRARRAAGKPGRRRGGRSGGGRLQEIATLHALVQQSHEHHPPLLVSFLTTRILRRRPFHR